MEHARLTIKKPTRDFMLQALKHFGFDSEELCVMYSGYGPVHTRV